MRTLSRSTKTNVDLWGICACCCTPAVLLWYNVSWPLRSAEGRLAVGFVCVCVWSCVSVNKVQSTWSWLKGPERLCPHTPVAPQWAYKGRHLRPKRSCAVSDRSIAYLSFPLTSSLTRLWRRFFHRRTKHILSTWMRSEETSCRAAFLLLKISEMTFFLCEG